MKTSHIIGISAGAVVGALLIGGTGFALGAEVRGKAEARDMVQSMVERQQTQRDFAEGPRGGKAERLERGFQGGPGRMGAHEHDLGEMQHEWLDPSPDDEGTLDDSTDFESDQDSDTTEQETSPVL